MKSGNLNLLEPSGPVQACHGIALPFTILNKRLSEYNVQTPKHVAVLQETDIVDIYCASVEQIELIELQITLQIFGNLKILFSLPTHTGLFEMIVWVLTTCHTQYTSDSSICVYLIEQHIKVLLHTLQVLYMCTFCDSTGLFEMNVGVLTTCHT